MKGEWCYFNSYFSPEICEEILEKGKLIPPQNGAIGHSGNIISDEVRKSKIRFINKDNKNFTFLFDELWKLAIQANEDWFNVHISRLNYIQLAEYSSEYRGEYKVHHDVFWTADQTHHRKLSAIIQLTDPNLYDGGDLEIVDCCEKPNSHDIKNRGSAIFFPSLITHKATEVTRGTRYSIAAWFEGPHWR